MRAVRMGRVAGFAVFAYRWIEKNHEEIEKRAQQLIDHADGRRYEPAVVPPTKVLKKIAHWIGEHADGGGGGRRKKK